MKNTNKNITFKARKLVYFFSYLVLISYFVASPHQAEASFLGNIWNSIIKIADFSVGNTHQDYNNFLSSVIESDPGQVLKETPLSRRVTLTGTLEVVHQDNFKQNKSKNLYFLKDSAGKKISLYFGEGEPGLSKAGSKIRIKQGARIGNKMAVESVSDKYFQIIAKPVAESIIGTKKIAVILFNFSNDTSQPSTADYLRKLIFTGKHDESQDSVNEFYQENSFEKTKLESHNRTDGDFYGWYTISDTNDDCASKSLLWKDAAAKLAQKDGYDNKNYYSTIYIMTGGVDCDWGGIATGNSGSERYSIINGSSYTTLYVIAHEVGHNLGLNHASSYYCTDLSGNQVSISPDCTAAEYGDIYDVMGGAVGHVNTASKGKLEWYSDQNKTEITEDGIYTLYPLEYSSSGAQSLRIARKDSSGTLDRYYYIEYRQLSNYDKNKGVSIRIGTDYENSSKTYLIDSDVSSDNYSLDAGKTFYDSLFGIEITTTEVSSSAAKVQVKFKKIDECVRANPSITFSPESYTGKGEKATYKIKITNNDKNCSAMIYRYFIIEMPNLWGYQLDDTNSSISAQSSKTSTLTLEPPSDVKEGKYSFAIKISNSLDESYSNSATGYYIVDYSSVASSSSSSSVNSSSSSSSSNSSSSSSRSSRSSSSKSRSSSSSSIAANHTAITNSATNITSTSATLNGAVNPKGENVYYQFKYRKESESPELTKKTSYVFHSLSDTPISAAISDLSPETRYVYRLYTYSYTTNIEVSGNLRTFKTLKPSSSSSSSSSSRSSRSSSSKARSSSSSSASNSSSKPRSSSSSVLPVIYTLTVSEAGPGIGLVASPGISCPSDCAENYPAGTTITLIATPATGFVFAGWIGCNISNGTSCIIQMDSSKSITANFVKP